MAHTVKRRRIEYDSNDYEAPDLQREHVLHKLKSKFESIFEKYGKDFEGQGDEIDLVTGQIVVNNGHLLTIRNEGDVEGGSYQERLYSTDDGDCVFANKGYDDYYENLDDNFEKPSEEDWSNIDPALRPQVNGGRNPDIETSSLEDEELDQYSKSDGSTVVNPFFSYTDSA
jgi:hypothetical protein